MSRYDPERHHRHTIRWQQWDYRRVGAYFVTIVSYGREPLFGTITNGQVSLSPYGEIVQAEWLSSPSARSNIELDEFIIMPNHLHGIIWITEQGDEGRSTMAWSLGAMVGGFKGAATKRINELRGTPRVPVWQRNYYERVIRDERELAATQQYIINNPAQWDEDDENPSKHP
ncbi:MAG: transposase [Candidatus Chloroheliales bacterium]|nr:MAG: transposase [Chloroflexota bacterium]